MYLDNEVFTKAICDYNRENAPKLFHKRFLGKFLKRNPHIKLGSKNKRYIKQYLRYLHVNFNNIVNRSMKQNSAIKRRKSLNDKHENQKKYFGENYSYIKKHLHSIDYIDMKAPSDYIGTSILRMAKEITKKPNFSSYSYKEDMVLEAVYQCLKYICNFSYYNNNAMSYFTSVIMFSFIRMIKKEKIHAYVRMELVDEYLSTLSESGIDITALLHYKSDYSHDISPEYTKQNGDDNNEAY